MITQRVWFVMVPLATLLAGGRFGATLPTPSYSMPVSVSMPISVFSTAIIGRLDVPTSAAVDPHVDVYGNEIEDAVSDYRVDTAGEIYEEHSPDTEVPRLPAPII